MDAYVLDWLSLLLRWAHLIVGIAWIGSSFYFVWLDSRLHRPPVDPEDARVNGDLWAVHGGGFYHAQKYLTGPQRLPPQLHWFKWEAYTTWLTGFGLLALTIWWRADAYLLDPAVAELSASQAIGLSALLLPLGWLVYDGLCRLPIGDRGIAALGFLLLGALSFGLGEVFSARGAFLQVGVVLGTLMVGNVFFVIIPGQRQMVDALARGEEPDPAPGLRGKQRSVHNNYMTLPVLFVMLSGHFPLAFGAEQAWLVLLAFFAIGALVRHFFNLRNVGRTVWALPAAAVAGLVLLAWLLAPAPREAAPPVAGGQQGAVSDTVALAIVRDRCAGCHAAEPTHPTAPVAPKGVLLETGAQLEQWADAVHEQTVVSRMMPLGNLTGITEAERQVLDAWWQGRAGG